MIDTSKHLGKFIIKSADSEEIVFNRVTNGFLNAIANALDGIPTDLEVKYLAIGDSTAVINDNDTTLGNELFRVQFASSSVTGTGEHTAIFPIADSEAVFFWKEIGIFCGSTASITPNSGTMISRILYSKDKTNLESYEIYRVDTIVRG